MSEEENIIIKKKSEIAEHDLDEKANGFNPIQDDGGGGGAKNAFEQFFPYNFYKHGT